MKKLMMVFFALLLVPAALSATDLQDKAKKQTATAQTNILQLQEHYPQYSLLLTDLAAAHAQLAEYCNLEEVSDNDIDYYYKHLFYSLESLSVQYVRIKNASAKLAHDVLPLLLHEYYVEEDPEEGLLSLAEMKEMAEDVMNSWAEEGDRTIIVPMDADLLMN